MNMKIQAVPLISLLRIGTIFSLTLSWLLMTTFAGYAGYQPQGGDPPRGGSTTSGMRL